MGDKALRMLGGEWRYSNGDDELRIMVAAGVAKFAMTNGYDDVFVRK
jgi:hypothetical protein